MIRAAVLALAAAVLAGEGGAAGLCLLPLENGAPVNEVEQRQPWRIIDGSGTIPGFPHVLVAPLNRASPDRQLYTVRGMRFEPLGAEFPRGPLWVSPVTPPGAGGTVYGWELLGRSLFRLSPGADEFERVAAAEGAAQFSHDAAEDRLHVLTGDGTLAELVGDRLVPSPLAGLNAQAPAYSRTATLPRFVPVLNGHLAADDGQLWFRPSGGDWAEVDQGGPIRSAWEVQDTAPHLDEAGRTLTFFLGGTALVLDAARPGTATVLARFGADARATVPGLPALAWESAGEPGFVARLLGNRKMRNLPRLVMVTRDGPVPPPGERVESHYPTDPRGVERRIPHAGFLPLPEFGTVLILHAGGRSAFLDGRVQPQPQLSDDRIGRHAIPERFSGKVVLRSQRGLFELAPDLSVTQRPLPFDPGQGSFDIFPSEAFGGAFLYRGLPDARLWFTPDGVAFDEVRNLAGAPPRDVGSDLPGRRAKLAVTDAGAALIADCP